MGKHRPGYFEAHRERHKEYCRQRQAAQRARNLASGKAKSFDVIEMPIVAERGRELTMMMRLPMLEWPDDLFSAVNGTQLGKVKKPDDTKCACGCDQLHRNNVSRVVEDQQFGVRTRRVVWYRSMKCKISHQGVRMNCW